VNRHSWSRGAIVLAHSRTTTGLVLGREEFKETRFLKEVEKKTSSVKDENKKLAKRGSEEGNPVQGSSRGKKGDESSPCFSEGQRKRKRELTGGVKKIRVCFASEWKEATLIPSRQRKRWAAILSMIR